MCLVSSCFFITNPYFCKPGGFLEHSFFLIAFVQFGCLQSDFPHNVSVLFFCFSCFVLPRILYFLDFTVQVPSLYTTKLSHGEWSVSRGMIAECISLNIGRNFLAEENCSVPSRLHCLCLWEHFLHFSTELADSPPQRSSLQICQPTSWFFPTPKKQYSLLVLELLKVKLEFIPSTNSFSELLASFPGLSLALMGAEQSCLGLCQGSEEIQRRFIILHVI